MSAPNAKIGVIFYSTYGHVSTLAEKVIEGLRSTGAEVVPYQIQETLSEDILGKMHAGGSLKPKYPIVTPNDLKELDGFLLGFPTRYGRAPAQVSAFFDATGGLWATGGLVGKFGGVFTSTASQHGGQETTALTTIPWFAHHGINFVPIGYVNQDLTDNSEIVGGSAYGAAAIAGGDGSRMPTAKELGVAEFQGQSFGKLVQTFVRGKHLSASATGTQLAAAPASETAAARELPQSQTQPQTTETKPQAVEQGYEVPSQTTESSAPPAAATAAAAAYPPPAAPTTTTNAPAQTSQTTSAAPPAKKKGGLFSCCGDKNID